MRRQRTSARSGDDVVGYMRKQQEHHARVSFEAEFRKFLRAYEIEHDERYV
jgi:hypothetical protein